MGAGEEAADLPASGGKLRGWVMWWVHLLVVVLLVGGGIAIVEGTPPDQGVNFALVFTALPLLVLGLPWSLPQVLFTYALEDFLFAHLPGPVAYIGLYVMADGPGDSPGSYFEGKDRYCDALIGGVLIIDDVQHA